MIRRVCTPWLMVSSRSGSAFDRLVVAQARDLGIPCVFGTENGSYRIEDGERIRLDGDAGTPEILG